TFLAALASATLASPFALPTNASGASRPALSHSAIEALENLAFSPSSQTTGSASSAVLACHQASATTATPESPTCTTFFTPGIDATLAASKFLVLPPCTGQSLVAAEVIFGSLCSAYSNCL